jgi:hypothetical protein
MKRAPSKSPTKLQKDQRGEEDEEELPPTPPAEDDETSEAPTPPPPQPAEDDETSEASYYSSDDSEYDSDDDKSVLSEFSGDEKNRYAGGGYEIWEEEVTLEQHFLGHNPGGAETLPKILDHLYDNLAKPLQDKGLLYAPRSKNERKWKINFLPSIKDHPKS